MNDLLTVQEVARLLRVHDATVRRWAASGLLQAVTLPHVGKRRDLRIKRAAIEAMLQGTTVQGGNEQHGR